MPINGEWFNPALGRCYRKTRYPNSGIAEAAARRASLKTGELIIAYKCIDCRRFHIGHADESQIIAHQRPDPPKSVRPIALPTICPHCNEAIPDERRREAERSGSPTVYCSRKCQQKHSRKARHKREAERMGRTPEFLRKMKDF